MRPAFRHDLVLAAGLTTAAAIVFAGPLASVVAGLGDFGRTRGVALMPGLAVAAAFVAYFYIAKRSQSQRRPAEGHTPAARAQDRARELERLLGFWQSLHRSLDLDSIREALPRHIDELTGRRDAWVLVRESGRWESLIGGHDGRGHVARAVEAVATDTLAVIGDVPSAEGHAVGGHLVFPMVNAGVVVGVIGLPEHPSCVPTDRRLMLGAAAALLAVSVRNAQLVRELRDTGLRDPLTRCVNRAHGLEVLGAELRRARRTQRPLSVLMFDLDHFKSINDKYGHLAGDAVLAALGARLHSVLRGSDLKCRYGGEEFLVVLPDTPVEGAGRVADTVRRELAESTTRWNGEALKVTASFGVAGAHTGEVDVHALMTRVDEALYRAKREGRNRVVVAAEPTAA